MLFDRLKNFSFTRDKIELTEQKIHFKTLACIYDYLSSGHSTFPSFFPTKTRLKTHIMDHCTVGSDARFGRTHLRKYFYRLLVQGLPRYPRDIVLAIETHI